MTSTAGTGTGSGFGAGGAERPSGTAADTVRQLVVLVTSVLAIVAAFLGSGAAGGTPIQDAAGGYLDADSTLIAPGRGAFAIWSLIYTGMFAYAIWQLLPAQRAEQRHRRMGYPIAASLVLNAVWIFVVQLGWLAVSLVVIVALLAVLAWIFVMTRRMPPRGVVDGVITDGSVGLYLGWVCVATAANATAVLVAAGFEGWGIPAETWAVVVIAVASAVGIALAVWGHGRIAPMLSLCWGLAWVAIARLTDEPASVVTGVAAIIGLVAVVIITVGARIADVRTTRRRSHETSEGEATAA